MVSLSPAEIAKAKRQEWQRLTTDIQHRWMDRSCWARSRADIDMLDIACNRCERRGRLSTHKLHQANLVHRQSHRSRFISMEEN
jgi:hypothetical protein